MRLVVTDQDLSGQVIRGRPFSYIGRCWGTDITFTGDWTHVSHFANIFIRPDWSKAKTRYSYSRFNTFTDIIASPDAELLDHEMMLALIGAGAQNVAAKHRLAANNVVTALAGDKAGAYFLVSWSNLTPDYMSAFKTPEEAETVFRQIVGGREHLVRHLLKHNNPADKSRLVWDEDDPPYVGHWGVEVNNWGVKAVSKDGKVYLKRYHELPVPANNHDRVEMAELIEAEVEKAVGFPATLNIQSILPWRASATYGKLPRDWWVQ